MEIDKLKYTGGIVTVAYTAETGNGTRSVTDRSTEPPRPELAEAMRALRPLVGRMAGISHAMMTGLHVTAVSRKGGLATITAQRGLLVIGIQNLPLADLGDDEASAVELVFEEAAQYIRGNRAQGGLDFGDDDEIETAADHDTE